jgi:hypothetical protein
MVDLPAPLRLFVRCAAAASRSCVGGGNRGLGRAGPRVYVGRAGKPAAGHRARSTTLGICCTAPNSRSKATIRVRGCLRDDVGSTMAALPIAAASLQRPIWLRSGQNSALKRLIAVRLTDASQSAQTTRQNLCAEVLAEYLKEALFPLATRSMREVAALLTIAM